jgi:hypothetical protein
MVISQALVVVCAAQLRCEGAAEMSHEVLDPHQSLQCLSSTGETLLPGGFWTIASHFLVSSPPLPLSSSLHCPLE